MTRPAADPLAELRLRDEILQAIFWLQGEGLAAAVAARDLAPLLVADEPAVARGLERLAATGQLERVEEQDPAAAGARFRLSQAGREQAARSFADEFAGWTHRGHYECHDDCWCHDPEHAGEPCPSHGPGHVHESGPVVG